MKFVSLSGLSESHHTNQAPKMYTIGTQYLSHGKHPLLCTVTDILTTRNSKGEQVRLRYETSHEFCGQTVTETDVNSVTIARGIMRLTEKA